MDLSSGILTLSDVPQSGEPLDILVAGDLCPRGRTEDLVLAGKSAEIVRPAARELARKDLSIVNLETPLTTQGAPIAKSGPNLRVHPRAIDLVRAAGFDVACCANNHVGDYGPAELLRTLDRLSQAGVQHVGAGRDLGEARKPLLVRRKGLTISILAFAENEFGGALRDRPGANPLQPLRNIADIRRASQAADITLVLVHGGYEYNPVPSPRRKETYRAFAEAGASAVVAGHPHCPQGIEIWRGVPIVYSLSNLLFDVDDPADDPHQLPAWWTGIMVRLSFAGSALCRLAVIPHHAEPDATRLKLYGGEDRARYLAYLDRLSQILQNDEEAERYWDACCTLYGPRYVTRLGLEEWPVDVSDGATLRSLLAARNLHTCEAHCELMTRFLWLAGEGRLDAAAAHVPALRALQEGDGFL